MKGFIFLLGAIGLAVWIYSDKPKFNLKNLETVSFTKNEKKLVQKGSQPPSLKKISSAPYPLVHSSRSPSSQEIEVSSEEEHPRLVRECKEGNRDSCRSLSEFCSKGDYDLCFSVGSILAQKDPTRAIPYYKAACDRVSHANSCYELALIMSSVHNPEPDNAANVLSYFSVACFGRNIAACLKMAESDPDPEQRKLYYAEAQKYQFENNNQ